VLASPRGEREMPVEDFYTGYRKNVLAPDEVVAWVDVPKPAAGGFMRVYKVSKRFDDDISAVCLAIDLHVEDGKVKAISIGAGGVAATPARAKDTQALVLGKGWSQATAIHAGEALQKEFQPLSDMRASAAYRSEILAALMQRFWLESQGMARINLESFALEDAP
jgi:xanthine dehydrogenase small subunit